MANIAWGKGAGDSLTTGKENVIMGHLIPAGTGLMKYDRLEIEVEADEDEELGIYEGSDPMVSEPLSAMNKEAGEK